MYVYESVWSGNQKQNMSAVVIMHSQLSQVSCYSLFVTLSVSLTGMIQEVVDEIYSGDFPEPVEEMGVPEVAGAHAHAGHNVVLEVEQQAEPAEDDQLDDDNGNEPRIFGDQEVPQLNPVDDMQREGVDDAAAENAANNDAGDADDDVGEDNDD